MEAARHHGTNVPFLFKVTLLLVDICPGGQHGPLSLLARLTIHDLGRGLVLGHNIGVGQGLLLLHAGATRHMSTHWRTARRRSPHATSRPRTLSASLS